MSQTQQSWRNHRNHLKKHHQRSPGHTENYPSNQRSKSNSRGGGQYHIRGGQAQQGKYFQPPRPRSNSLSLPKGKRAVYGLRSRFEGGQKELRKSDTTHFADQHNFEDQQHICQLHSDTLDQCLEKSGIYVCKSYAPRCFIIQKVIFKLTQESRQSRHAR